MGEILQENRKRRTVPQSKWLEKKARLVLRDLLRSQSEATLLKACEVTLRLYGRASVNGDGVDIAGPTLVERYGQRKRREALAKSASESSQAEPGASGEPTGEQAGAGDRGPFDDAPVPPADLTPDGARAYPSISPSPPENFSENLEKSAPTGESDGLAKV